MNKELWGGRYDWPAEGDEWSADWGGAAAQWYGTVLPRIHGWLPATTILEIAPGFGRWTQYLKDECSRLMLVDLNGNCIEHCRDRFVDVGNIEYHVNDGVSLDMIPDGTVDFVFSFDSLVHAEIDVLDGYLAQLRQKLTPNGGAFLHHSNMGAYATRWGGLRRLPVEIRKRVGPGSNQDAYQFRAFSVTASAVAERATAHGLSCIAQEAVAWRQRLLIDAFSLFVRDDSPAARAPRVVNNRSFMAEARRAARLAAFYSRSPEGDRP